MASNYPPGVTGNEYAIGGAQAEWEADAICPACGWEGPMPHEAHREFGIRAWCANPDEPGCPGNREGFEIYEDEVEPDLGDPYIED